MREMITMTARRVPVFLPERTITGKVRMTTTCTCREQVRFLLTQAEWDAWLRHPQDQGLLPELELLLATGMHPACIAAESMAAA